MKPKSLIQFLGLVLTIVFLGSCSGKLDEKETKELLVGKWRVDELKFSHDVDESKKKLHEAMMEDYQNNATFEFKADHTYEAIYLGMVVQAGSWSLDMENQVITLGIEEPKTPNSEESDMAGVLHDKVHIESLSEDEIALSLKESDGATTTAHMVPAE